MTATQASGRVPRSSASGNILVGRLRGLFGTHGWLKVHSYTRPREDVFSYPAWLIRTDDGWVPYELVAHRKHGAALLVSLSGVTDRDSARKLLGCDVAILPTQLPAAKPGEYYWVDLIGTRVRDLDGRVLGDVIQLYETGEHDVLFVRGEREHLIPFVVGVYVIDVDLDERWITVDWHPED